MSQFEYVSVAVALLYAVAVGRLLTAMPDVFDPERRYGVHAAWCCYLLVFCISMWFAFWNWRQVEFGPLTFLGALTVPALVIVRAELLCGRASREIVDYRAHFYSYSVRVPFFAVGLFSICFLTLSPWVAGFIPWGELTRFHAVMAIFVAIWSLGLITDRPRVHGALVTAQLGFAVLNFFWGTSPGPT